MKGRRDVYSVVDFGIGFFVVVFCVGGVVGEVSFCGSGGFVSISYR